MKEKDINPYYFENPYYFKSEMFMMISMLDQNLSQNKVKIKNAKQSCV